MEWLNLAEIEHAARERLTPDRYGYIASGADDEVSLRANREAFERWRLVPRYLVDVSAIDLSTTVLGQRLALPVLLAPAAFQVLADADGERASARAAHAAGTVFVASTLASYSLEEIAAASDGPRWFQLYCARDRGITEALVRAAAEHGYQALCLTVDVPVVGRREADHRNRMHLPPAALPRNILRFLDLEALSQAERVSALDRLVDQLFDPSLSWRDLGWLRGLTDLPLVIKGLLSADDAVRAVEHGVDAVVVSNHGGRQLDAAPSPLEVLPEIVDAVGGRCPLLIDGGIRRGTDVVKALALGATATLIGRPYVWGLAAGGEAGVSRVLALLRAEIERAMALTGRTRIDQLDASLVRPAWRP